MAQFVKHFVQDLAQDIRVRQCGTIVFNADDQSNVITVDLYNGNEPASLSGSVVGAVICSDGSTVPVTGGTISGNTVSITLTAACFAIEGPIGVGVQVVSGTQKTTVLKAIYNVELFTTDNVVDPGSRITVTVSDLVNDIEEATAAIPASDMAALMAGIAPTFSNSTAYKAGAYVYYSGTLYRFTADHAAGTWTGSDAVQVALANDLGDQVSVLKSAIDTMSAETGRNLLNEKELLNITDSSYANGWYSFVPKNVSTLYGPGEGKASFPHRAFKENTQYTLSFDGAYTGSVSSTYIIGFKYTDGTDSRVAVWGSAEDHYKLTSTANKTIARVYFDWNYNVTSRIKNLMMVEGTTEPTEFIPYGERTAVDDGAREQISLLREHDTLSELMNFEQGKNIYNSYDLIHYKWIYPTNGSIEDSEYYEVAYSPTYIPVAEGETLTATERMFIAFYDDEYNVVSALQMGTDKQTTVPTGAKFVRLSCSATNHATVKVVKGTSVGASVGRYSFSLKGLKTDDNDKIIVDANGGGDYTSFTEAVYNNVDNGKLIIVNAGTYDIEAEYIALFGQSVVNSLSDSTTGINNFQYGVRIHDRKVIFESGSHIVCDWTGKTIDASHRFCALRVEPNAELIGLDLDCTATFYCIHDDYGTEDDTPFTIKYENCRVIGHNLYNANCIGGGAHKYSRHILRNCYFKNNVVSSDRVLSADVRYHNTDTANAEPELYVSNCYFSNNMNVTYYGNQTTKMKAYVNNCFAPYGIIKRAESSLMSVDNVELYTWNNQKN